MKRKSVFPMVLFAGILTTAMRAADGGTIVYVDENATGSTHDGSSWCTAHLTFSEALEAVTPPVTIRVADGTYTPNPSGWFSGRYATFQLINGVTTEGGYAGCGAPDPDERDIVLYETILSGDLGVVGDETDNTYHVVLGGSTNPSAVLDGFTVTGGHADGFYYPNHHGGGMYIHSGSPTVRNCTFSGNSAARDGGGMYNNYYSSPTLTNCTFSGNSAWDDGGGMYNWYGSPTLTNCAFNDNSAGLTEFGLGGGLVNYYGRPTLTNCMFSGNWASRGGGMDNGPASPTLTDCTFSGNSATDGGGMYNHAGSPKLSNCAFRGNSVYHSGGGMYISSGSPILMDCTFSSNSADDGGGMYCDSDYPYGNPILTNCTFSGNSADDGGGIFIYGRPTLTNCTFSGNSARDDGGGMYNWAGSPTLTNLILWGNSDSGEMDESAQIHRVAGTPIVDYSCVQGWTGSWGGEGNSGDEPLFVRNPSDGGDGWGDNPATPHIDEGANDNYGDLRLRPGSPCIDTGDNAALPPDSLDLDRDGNTYEPIPYDLAGEPRIEDGDGDATVTVDRGAYEFQRACMAVSVLWVDPPDGVVDARQPHPVDSKTPLQGIDTIEVTAPSGALNCWSLCEVEEDGLGPNGVAAITRNAGGSYAVLLKRPITPGSVTTLTYTPDGGRGAATTGTFIAHPANANAESASDSIDILDAIDYLNGVSTPPWGLYSTNINHDGGFGSLDILRLIDLLNGADTYDPWNGTPLPVNDGSCP